MTWKRLLPRRFNVKSTWCVCREDRYALTRLRLKFTHLNKHKLCHNFKDTVFAMCDYGTETETTGHFFLR